MLTSPIFHRYQVLRTRQNDSGQNTLRGIYGLDQRGFLDDHYRFQD